MKKFIRLFLLFMLPILLLPLIEAFVLPVAFFTHRSWEALQYYNRFLAAYGPLYANQHVEKIEVGDLGHHTANAIQRKTIWQTDRLGFRNDQVMEESDIILLGDSFFAGTGLSQEETLAAQLMKKSDKKYKVYNISGATFGIFNQFLNEGVIKKPKIIIYSSVERGDVPEFNPNAKRSNTIKKIKTVLDDYGLNLMLDRITRCYFLEWTKSRVQGKTGMGFPSENDPNFLFFNGKTVKDKMPELEQNFKYLVAYKKHCDKLGIQFLFVPIPNKETVYFDLVPLKAQPEYIPQFVHQLNDNGINAINTVACYNKARSSNPDQLYYLKDDTHWNSDGVSVLADEILLKINSQGLK